MKTIKLSLSNRYRKGNTTYIGGKKYTLNDDLADSLLASRNERDMPYFIRVDSAPDPVEDDEVDAPKTTAKKKPPRKKVAKKSAGDEPAVSV